MNINDAVMQRHRETIVIEVTGDSTIHVTLDGLHSINDVTAFVKAITRIYERRPELPRAV